MSQTQSLPLIIGVGNEYSCDDAVGLIVARRLKERLADSVTVLEQSGDGAALIEAWRGAETVIIIDAVMSSAAPGTIHLFDANMRPLPKDAFRYTTHAFGVVEAIELSRALGELPRSLTVCGIEGKNFAAGVGLSPEVEKAACEALRQLFAGGLFVAI
ncbi:MAG: hydrogenase maturation protease [Blastocatellia bacterium]|nr:hydrogenase maturation protease [Blastocatellia bacterium]